MPLRAIHSRATAARCTFSRAMAAASAARCTPLGYSGRELRSPNFTYIGAATAIRSAASCPRTMPPIASGASTYRSIGTPASARISASWPVVTSAGTLTVEPPSRSSWRSVSGLDGAITADTFHTTQAGSSPTAWSPATSSSRPVSAIRKPRMPCSTPRSTSSRAYRS
ncbi:MAG TPA: hypothetical protein VGG25_27390 [Streptosporangiaceae bacterium]